jgi:hypothetical protein
MQLLSMHIGGGVVHVPPEHVAGATHGPPVPQWHVPPVHVSPAAHDGVHVSGAHAPPVHVMPLGHAAPVPQWHVPAVHVSPVWQAGVHVAGAHDPPLHAVPTMHGALEPHMHVEPVMRVSSTHVPEQHVKPIEQRPPELPQWQTGPDEPITHVSPVAHAGAQTGPPESIIDMPRSLPPPESTGGPPASWPRSSAPPRSRAGPMSRAMRSAPPPPLAQPVPSARMKTKNTLERIGVPLLGQTIRSVEEASNAGQRSTVWIAFDARGRVRYTWKDEPSAGS